MTSTNLADWPQEQLSDLARIVRDHEFLRVLAAAVAKKGLGNPITDVEIASSIAPQLEVDSGLSASSIAHLIRQFHAVNTAAAPPIHLAGVGDNLRRVPVRGR